MPSGASERPLAFLTGASSGIGAELARGLARRGYRLVLIALDAAPMHALVKEINAAEHSTVVPLDLADPEALDPVVRPLLARLGCPSVVINCAGQGIYRPFTHHAEADHRRLMQINHFAALKLIELVLPGMLRRGDGTIINVSSMACKTGAWGHSAYAASKAALAALTHSLAAEHAGTKIHFCCVYPGIVATRYFSHPDTKGLWEVVKSRAMPASIAADRILDLLEKPRLELHIPRCYRLLDWMKAIAPRLTHAIVTWQSRPQKSWMLQPAPSGRRVALTDQLRLCTVDQKSNCRPANT